MGDRAFINQSYGGRQSLLDGEAIQSAMGGAQGSGGTPAPTFTVQPLVSPSSGTAGTTTFTATPGTVSNGSITSRAWLLNGSSISSALTALPVSDGTLTYQEFASGPGGGASSVIRSVTVNAGTVTPPFASQQRQSSIYGSSTVVGEAGAGVQVGQFTATFNGTDTMTVTAVNSGTIQVGDCLVVQPAINFAASIAVEQILTGSGGVGTYRMTAPVPARAATVYTTRRALSMPVWVAKSYTPAGVVANRGLSGQSLLSQRDAINAMSSADVTPINMLNQGFSNENPVPQGTDTITTIVERCGLIRDALTAKGGDPASMGYYLTYDSVGLASGNLVQKLDWLRKLSAVYPGKADSMTNYSPTWTDPTPSAPLPADQIDRMLNRITSPTYLSAAHLSGFAMLPENGARGFIDFVQGADSGCPNIPYQELYVSGAAADTAQTNGGAVGQVQMSGPLNGSTIALSTPSTDFAVSSIGAITRKTATVIKADYTDLWVQISKGGVSRAPKRVRVFIGEGASAAYNRVKHEAGLVANVTGSATGTTLTVDSTDAQIVAGGVPVGAGQTTSPTITQQLTGLAGGAGTYQLSSSATIAQSSFPIRSRNGSHAQAAAISTTPNGSQWTFIFDFEALDASQDLQTHTILAGADNAVGTTFSIQRVNPGYFAVAIRSLVGTTTTTIYNGTIQFSAGNFRAVAGRRKWLMVSGDFGATPVVKMAGIDVTSGNVTADTLIQTPPVADSTVGIAQPLVYGASTTAGASVNHIQGMLWMAAGYIDVSLAANQQLFMGADRMGVALPSSGAVTVAAGATAGQTITPYVFMRGKAGDRAYRPNAVGNDADQGIIYSMIGRGSHPARATDL